eukprot:3850701-Prymnesium_polylepis.2
MAVLVNLQALGHAAQRVAGYTGPVFGAKVAVGATPRSPPADRRPQPASPTRPLRMEYHAQTPAALAMLLPPTLRALQEFLKQRGHPSILVDGYFAMETKRALQDVPAEQGPLLRRDRWPVAGDAEGSGWPRAAFRPSTSTARVGRVLDYVTAEAAQRAPGRVHDLWSRHDQRPAGLLEAARQSCSRQPLARTAGCASGLRLRSCPRAP